MFALVNAITHGGTFTIEFKDDVKICSNIYCDEVIRLCGGSNATIWFSSHIFKHEHEHEHEFVRASAYILDAEVISGFAIDSNGTRVGPGQRFQIRKVDPNATRVGPGQKFPIRKVDPNATRVGPGQKSQTRNVASYKNFSHEEYETALQLLKNISRKTSYYCLQELEKNFPKEKADAILNHTSFRPGTNYTNREREFAITQLQEVSIKTSINCIQKLLDDFSPERTMAILRSTSFRQGEDYTQEELNIASTLLQEVPEKTYEAYLNALKTIFTPRRAQSILDHIVSQCR